jgi:hypothetical protein
MLILRRSNCIVTASGIVTLCRPPYSAPVESGHSPLSPGAMYVCVYNRVKELCVKLVYGLLMFWRLLFIYIEQKRSSPCPAHNTMLFHQKDSLINATQRNNVCSVRSTRYSTGYSYLTLNIRDSSLQIFKKQLSNFTKIWCFSDRASQYRLVSITNLMHNSFIL